jgi:hypothetical protein
MRNCQYRIIVFLIGLFGVSALSAQQLDSLDATRLSMRCVQFGIGYSDVLDTYLSPQIYKGLDIRGSREMMRMTKMGGGNVSIQSFFQSDFSFTKNKADNNTTLTGLVNWNYGLHYQFRISDNFKLLAGGLADMNLGFIYNLRNSNNPASLRAYINIDASAAAIWHFNIKKTKLALRYQVNVPVAGVMFSPEMGESYYEIFSLGHYGGTIKLTSLHNQPSLRQLLSLDLPLGSQQIRLTYLGDFQQSKLNGLKTHIYTHAFMVGFVRTLYKVNRKEAGRLPASLKVY